MKRKLNVTAFLAVLLITLMIGQPVSASHHQLTITPLAGYGSDFAIARDINSRGQVIGYGDTGQGSFHVFLWEKGSVTDLGVLPNGTDSMGLSINDRGQVVGWSDTDERFAFPFLWDNGTMIGLSESHGVAEAINARGQAVGNTSVPSGDNTRAVLWQKGKMIDLGMLPGGFLSDAYGINDKGQVVGLAYNGSGTLNGYHAFLWQAGKMHDLGILPGGTTSIAFSINERGQIVGHGDTASGDTHAILWQDGKPKDLGTLGGPSSYAVDINAQGQVVGYSDTASGATHAFIWEKGSMTDLGVLGADTLSRAWGINDKGQVVGESQDSLAISHAVIWTK
jgi:probable HAF family extracellular repeat protein